MISTLYSPGRGELRWSHRRFCRDNESSPMQCVMAPKPIATDIDPHKMTISIHYKMSCNFLTKECGGEKWTFIRSCGDRVLGGDVEIHRELR